MRAIAWSLLAAAIVAAALHALEVAIFLALAAVVVYVGSWPDPRRDDARRRNRSGDRW